MLYSTIKKSRETLWRACYWSKASIFSTAFISQYILFESFGKEMQNLKLAAGEGILQIRRIRITSLSLPHLFDLLLEPLFLLLPYCKPEFF